MTATLRQDPAIAAWAALAEECHASILLKMGHKKEWPAECKSRHIYMTLSVLDSLHCLLSWALLYADKPPPALDDERHYLLRKIEAMRQVPTAAAIDLVRSRLAAFNPLTHDWSGTSGVGLRTVMLLQKYWRSRLSNGSPPARLSLMVLDGEDDAIWPLIDAILETRNREEAA